MKIGTMKELLNAKVFCCEENLDKNVFSACGSDLMSDVLAFVKEKTVLITGLTNTHVIRTAEMLDISCVVFSRGKIPGEDILEMAKEIDIPVLSTKHTTYVTCGILYSKGLPGNSRKE